MASRELGSVLFAGAALCSAVMRWRNVRGRTRRTMAALPHDLLLDYESLVRVHALPAAFPFAALILRHSE
jgi:hypothetical protein